MGGHVLKSYFLRNYVQELIYLEIRRTNHKDTENQVEHASGKDKLAAQLSTDCTRQTMPFATVPRICSDAIYRIFSSSLLYNARKPVTCLFFIIIIEVFVIEVRTATSKHGVSYRRKMTDRSPCENI